MARLTGEVEKKILTPDKAREPRPVAHVGEVHAQATGDAEEIAPVATLLRFEAVDDGHPRAQGHECPREIGPDETKPTRD